MKKIRMGMVGGGEGAFIGPIHRMAAELDGYVELVCGAFASDAQRSLRSGQSIYGLPAGRCYPDFDAMMITERRLPAAQRMQFVSIVTPNHVHHPVAVAALEAGFHVLSDKPVTTTAAQAIELAEIAQRAGLLFGVSYNYTGYPMVREARQRILEGQLGSIRRVNVEYLQGWLSGAVEAGGNKQAQWRTDPARAGIAGCFGDIGTHAENLLHFVTGSPITELCADLSSFVPNRSLDDDGNVLLRLANGARGLICASQIAIGEDNGLRLRVYGDKGGLRWDQGTPNELWLSWPDRSTEVLRSGGPSLGIAAGNATRLPAGHPEGFIEAFANVYRGFAESIAQKPAQGLRDCPDIADGLRGMRFVEAIVESSIHGAWVQLEA
jgi:predicted dehydrogenase